MPPAKDRAARIKEAERRIVPLADSDEHLKVLVYGKNKVGKTRFAYKAPKVIGVDINEKGTASVRNMPGAMFPAREWADMTYIYWYLRQGNHEYQTVVLDTITQMQHMCLKFVLKENEDRDPNKDPSTPIQRDWLKMAELMKPMLLNFRNLPMHVVFLAQERNRDDDDGNKWVVPDLSPGVLGTALSCVSIIGHMFQHQVRVVDKSTKKETKRWYPHMLVGPHSEYPTGDRTGSLRPVVRNPTMDSFIEAYKGE